MENNFAGKTAGVREKSFPPKLTDYFIQGVRKGQLEIRKNENKRHKYI